MTAGQDINQIPNCAVCDQPLTVDNEWDFESGWWYSTHGACMAPSVDGRFYVRSYFDGDERTPHAGYTHSRRAVWEADHLARCNRCRWTFDVVDRTTGDVVHRAIGTLRETSPDGRPFYREVWARTVEPHGEVVR